MRNSTSNGNQNAVVVELFAWFVSLCSASAACGWLVVGCGVGGCIEPWAAVLTLRLAWHQISFPACVSGSRPKQEPQRGRNRPQGQTIRQPIATAPDPEFMGHLGSWFLAAP